MIEQNKKRLIIIGNKISYPEYNNVNVSLSSYKEFIQNCDYVCRVNRMHNYDITTGTKTDGLYIGGWPDFMNQHKGGQHTDVMKTVKDIFVDRRAWPLFEPRCLEFITQELRDNLTICPFAEQKEHIGCQYPCSVILMIDYFATTKPWCDEYEIWFTGIDVQDRQQVLTNGWQWKTAGHVGGAEAEQNYLYKMLKDGKIKHLEEQLYKEMAVKEHVPILIPIKQTSKRCPYKNEHLLPYTLGYLKRIGRIKDAVIISDGNAYRYLANQYGTDYYVERRPQDGDEMTAIAQFLKAKPAVQKFVWLPVAQPCRDDLLIDRVLECEHDGLVTSYVERSNRDIFKLDDNLQFNIKDSERKGCMCTQEKVADGAIYCLTRSYFDKVIASENRNYTFWNTNVKFIENKAPLVDIDTKEELLLFFKYYGRL